MCSSDLELIEREVSVQARIAVEKWKKSRGNESEVAKAAAFIAERPLHLIDKAGLDIASLCSRARKLHASLAPVRQALKSTRPAGKVASHQKYWQELLGQAGGAVRRPLQSLTDAEKQRTREAFEACGLRL